MTSLDDAPAPAEARPRLTLGSCPDSWGVWYPVAGDLPFGQAVAAGASCEPPGDIPDIPSVMAALRTIATDLFVIVEQDMYPAPFDKPAPIARRTREYLTPAGFG